MPIRLDHFYELFDGNAYERLAKFLKPIQSVQTESSSVGTLIFSLLISVHDTCRIRYTAVYKANTQHAAIRYILAGRDPRQPARSGH